MKSKLKSESYIIDLVNHSVPRLSRIFPSSNNIIKACTALTRKHIAKNDSRVVESV